MLRHLISASILPVHRFHSYQRRILRQEEKPDVRYNKRHGIVDARGCKGILY
jgi:hypothetical protein